MHQLRQRWNWPAGSDEIRRGCAIALAAGSASPARARRKARRARSRLQDALAALKAGNERFVSHPELCSSISRRAAATSPEAQAPWATIISLRRQPRASRTHFRRPWRGRTVRLARRRQSRRYRDAWAPSNIGAAVLGSPLDRDPRPHRLRRCEGRLRCGHQERNLSWRNRPDDRADHPRRACGAQRPRRFHQQRRQGKREADRGPS